MKANEAPEKIYRRLEGKYIKYYDYKPAKISYDETAVEYTRIDVFVDKAVEWLKSHSENDYVEYHMGVTIIHKDKFIKDFRDEIERI